MKKTITKIVALAFCVIFALSLSSCAFIDKTLTRIEQKVEDIRYIQEGWDFNHNRKIDDEERINIFMYELTGTDSRPAGHANCDDGCKFKDESHLH